MSYQSVDKLQNALGENIFYYTKDKKKAAGRALGTLVEIITFYLIKSWKLSSSASIERGLQEYGNPEISHNVEYSLHPIQNKYTIKLPNKGKSITANSLLKELEKQYIDTSRFKRKNNTLLSIHNIIRNACTIGISNTSYLIATLTRTTKTEHTIEIIEQSRKAYAIFECKRVGIEEGNKKGPQTIEKAKQGAYVARTVSSLQKIRTDTGELYGILHKGNKTYSNPYNEMMQELIFSKDNKLLEKFVLTIGVVSNHGNWFTFKNQNKELKVLAQSYDWLLFLTDIGLSEFIEELILNPNNKYKPIRDAFVASYSATKKKNRFTKVQMDCNSDRLLNEYFYTNKNKIESWFNIISPANKTINELKRELKELRDKNWKNII